MSQITTTADLVLQNQEFLNGLAVTETAYRAWAARMSSIPVNVPITQQGQVDRAVGSLANDAMRRTGTPTAAMLEDAGGLRTRIAQLTELRNAVKSGGTGQAMLDSAIQGMESRLAKLAPAAAAATAQAVTQAGTAAETAITNAAGKLTEAVAKTATGATASSPADDEVPTSRGGRGGFLNQRFSRSAVGGLIAYYGIQQLEQTVGQVNDLQRTNQIEDPVEQAKARADIAREQNSGLIGWMRRRVSQATTPRGSSTADLGGNTQQAEEISAQAVKDAEKGAEHAKIFDKGVEANEETAVRLAELVSGAAAGHRAALAKWMKAQEKAAAALAETGNPQSGDEAKKMLAQAQAYVRAQNQAIDNNARAQEDATQLDVQQTDRAGTAAAMEAQGRRREAEVMQRQAAIRDRVESARIAWLGENGDPVKKEDARRRYEAERDAAPAEQAAVTYDEDLYQRRQDRQAEATVSDLNARTQFNRMRAGGTVADEHAASLAEQNDAAGSTVRQLQRQLDVEDDPKQQKRLQRGVNAATEDETAQKAANSAREIRRVRESVSDFIIAKDRAELGEAERDYTKQTDIFNKEWDKRLRTVQTGTERAAAIQERMAERSTAESRHSRDVIGIAREGTEAYLRTGGNDRAADLMAFNARVQDDVRQAGDDTDQRRAVLYRARGQLQGMARQFTRPQRFGSNADYLSSVQDSAFRGSGDVMGLMQTLNKDYGKGMAGTKKDSDEALFDAGKELNKAADKLNKQTVYVLKY